MPLLLVVVGLMLVVTALRGTTADFGSRLSQDVSGGFLKWVAAIIVVGMLGYVPGLQTPSRYLLGLIVIAILISQGSGFLDQFVQQIENPPPPTQGQQPTVSQSSSAGSIFGGIIGGSGGGMGLGGGSGGSTLGTLGTVASIAAIA